ncbi:DNA protecting protein DprA [Marinobacter santoriniensis NKSG1]|uniref:DNA protecting protein DprA n=1 Tax=Marinobacter santoriniensis NKSG1 TaxID=1288826 RepID=M7CLT3_9GAMM|nr:DNA-processing protein DprA [Marinobacter santoriniensis]EMP54596.1 DNA protecting protein DprA [Marinobacter santoriniensis NKSG1]
MKTSLSGGESPLLADDPLADPAAPWVLLTRLPGFGIRRRQSVLQVVHSLSDVLSLSSATLHAMGLNAEALTGILAWQRGDRGHPLMMDVAAIVRDCRAGNITILTWPDHNYPEALRHIHNPPLALYCLGDTALLQRDQIGIVGSRHATPAGLDHARRFAATLGERGLLVTSGLALGIDGAAHAGALDAGAPTVAVIGSGPDRLYPRQHQKLGRRIVERGVIVSEYPPGTPARAGHFPQRNRIISGLSRGILVVEAGLKSGSLISARLALEQGREVFAIPGSVHSPVARGCHHLIKQGARLVETVDDVLEELGTWWSLQPTVTEKPEAAEGPDLSALAKREIAVFRALGYDPVSTDALASATGLSADQLMQSLLLLELQGLVASAPGGYLRLA